jgi:hypothetical protein
MCDSLVFVHLISPDLLQKKKVSDDAVRVAIGRYGRGSLQNLSLLPVVKSESHIIV